MPSCFGSEALTASPACRHAEVLLLSTVAYFGDVGALLNAIKGFTPFLVTAKFIIAFPVTYHFLAGLRHFWWDYAKHSEMVGCG